MTERMPELEPGDEVGFEIDGRMEWGIITEEVYPLTMDVGVVYKIRTQCRVLYLNRSNIVEWNKS
jgi:hypothetical protein